MFGGLINGTRRWFRSSKGRKLLGLFLVALFIVSVGFIPVRIAIARYRTPQPEAILVLGGHPNRVTFAAQFWQSHSNLDIWLSSQGSDSPYYRRIFREAGVPEHRVHFEVNSTDTVTNFTYTLDELQQRNVRHVFLITSDYHMRRSRAIATLVFGSHGIIFTPLSVPAKGFPPESHWRVFRDILRSILWLFTGYSGANLNPDLQS